MLIEAQKLIGLPVYTKSGAHLGKVDDLEIDIDEQTVINYRVETREILKLKNLFAGKLLIHRDQIISITSKKVIVDDTVKENTTELVAGKAEEVIKGAPVTTANS